MSDRRKNTPEEISEVALGFAAGKTVQWRTVDGVGHWESHPGVPMFNFYYYQYRIAPPAPRELLVIFKDDEAWHTLNEDITEDAAQKKLSWYKADRTCVYTLVKFKEVQKSP
jgi:hypothetical protein